MATLCVVVCHDEGLSDNNSIESELLSFCFGIINQ